MFAFCVRVARKHLRKLNTSLALSTESNKILALMDLTLIVLSIVDVCVPRIAVICNFDEAQFELHVLKGQNVRASSAVHQGTWAVET